MQFNVSELLKEHVGATREFDIDDDVTIDGKPRHLTGHARFDRTNDGILVRADVRGAVAAECARCLRPLELPVEITFEEEFIPTVDIVSGGHVDAPEGEEENYRISARHMLDLMQPVAEYWSIAQPMAPVCRDDCPGLCPICGGDLNDAGHACTREAGDDRWAKLRNLELG